MTRARSLFLMIVLVAYASFSAQDPIKLNRMYIGLQETLNAEAVVGLLEFMGHNPWQTVLKRTEPNWTSIVAELRVHALISPEDVSGLKAALSKVSAQDALRIVEDYERDGKQNLTAMMFKVQKHLTKDQLRGVLTHFGLSKNKISQLMGPLEVLWAQLWGLMDASFGSDTRAFLDKVRQAQVRYPGLSVMTEALEHYLNDAV